MPSSLQPHGLKPARLYSSPLSLSFTALDFTFTTRHIHNWASFPRWLSHFILSGVISNCSPLFPGSILDTFQPEGVIFWYHIFLPFHTVYGVLQAKILDGVAISSSIGPHFIRWTTCPSCVTLHNMTHSFIKLCKPLRHDKLWFVKGKSSILQFKKKNQNAWTVSGFTLSNNQTSGVLTVG